ncbi:hypothetical protein MMC30_003741 [Trapelia coarctata]|nr:hypothetical protein [Trapelia coarctata]
MAQNDALGSYQRPGNSMNSNQEIPGSSTLVNRRIIAEFSPATLRGGSVQRDSSSVDVELSNSGTPFEGAAAQRRFVVSIDFGTTFSSVSFMAFPENETPLAVLPSEIKSVVNYPDEPRLGFRERRREVPTESWYPNRVLHDDQDATEIAGNLDDPNDEMLEDLHEGGSPTDSQEVVESIEEEIEIEMEDGAEDHAEDDDSRDFFWGFGVQRQLQFPDTNRNQNRRVKRSKLLLDNSDHTREIRNQLRPILNRLKNKKLIRNDEDVIADFLEHLFRHVKEQLIRHYGFSDACPVEFVLCVPAMWTQKASRTMQSVMETAIRRSGFGNLQDGSVEDLFIVSEPEAASAHVLADTNEVKLGETFVLIDAGGGTVDAITYTVDRHYPLRLKREAVKPGGELCGSSYLNEDFHKHLLERLQDELYLEINGLTIESIVEKETIDFENRLKRTFDIARSKFPVEEIFIQGLVANHEKRFSTNRLKIQKEDLNNVFKPRLKGVARLMREQLELASQKNLDVKKVILIGGFASSPSLQNYLRQELKRISEVRGRTIRLIDPNSPETAVASGAILRALNKENGPARVMLSSYGFLRTEPYEPEVVPAHREIKRPWHDPLDGRKYVKNTIDWLVKKGEEIPPHKVYPISVLHTFPVTTRQDQRFLCEEKLYVSDTSTESHYRIGDPKNRGAEIAGCIVADMTFLKTDGIIVPVEPEPGERAKRHWKVEYELVMIVNGRNMRYEARYPAGGEVQQKGQISIAAAFVPGTN